MISEFLHLEFTADDFLLTFAIMAGVMLILLILVIVNMVKTSKIKKKYESFMVGKDAKSLEENLIKRIHQVEDLLVSEKRNEENIEKIFNKFYQVDGSEFTEGNGIGLSIVKHIVELHNGKITAFSKNNKTTFTIELPKQ